MSHIGIICPNTNGHINAMLGIAYALRELGHSITFFLLGPPPTSVTSAGIAVIPLGEEIFPIAEYQDVLQKLGSLSGRAALEHTISFFARAAEAILATGATQVSKANVDAMLIDQASFVGGTVADELGIPFATICNAVIFHPDPYVPPFFTTWRPHRTWWASMRNQLAWALYQRKLAPILATIRAHRRKLAQVCQLKK